MNKRFIFLLLAGIGFAGCSEHKENTVQSSSALSDSIEVRSNQEKSLAEKNDSTQPFRLNSSELSEGFGFKGNFLEAWQWYDANGKNVLILSVSDKKIHMKDVEEEANTRELFGKHYVVRETGGKPEILWELYDLEKECIFDLTAEFLFSPVLTDLDADGIKESFLVYQIGCRSDVSPVTMKIIVHEDKAKYALRGSTYVPMNDQSEKPAIDTWEPDASKHSIAKDDFTGKWGRYDNANDFEGAPASFLEKARALWLENITQ